MQAKQHIETNTFFKKVLDSELLAIIKITAKGNVNTKWHAEKNAQNISLGFSVSIKTYLCCL